MAVRVERVVTTGVFRLDGQSFDVDNNVWLVGDDHEVLIVDAAHDDAPILEAVGGRSVTAVVCTHGHNDHVNAAVEVSRRTGGAPVLLHPADLMLWTMTHPHRSPDGPLADGEALTVAGTDLTVLHTPGHSPGGICLHAPSVGAVFSGDTLFKGGPGATGRSYSDFPTILRSINDRLLTLPEDTVVHAGHGDDTTIGGEATSYDDWVARGH